MYEIKIRSEFSSAHRLRGYKGRCEELHGHNWKIEAAIEEDKLDKVGMVFDFKELKLKLNGILTQLDHKYLNDLSYFKKVNLVRKKNTKNMSKFSNGVNHTSENIAKYIYDRLNRKLKNSKLKASKVTVWESDASAVSFYEK